MATAEQALHFLQRDLRQLVPGVQVSLWHVEPGRYGYLIAEADWPGKGWHANAEVKVDAASWGTRRELWRAAGRLRDALHWQREQALRAGRERVSEAA